ncbi:DUF4232 domain-containing protein [Streptomyces sp. 8K308]|uniref:DUF4232 domain-containing protein n=1 Tax=Streptomyces sp. 8K308 TaxID=2530388 RepID=UPI0010437337|nr:DUF4232 domain-containing protein [Streptomyces sp. 8K308]TDC10272.1 DUF4232 domain-containing protein [Streptomyces sp. 8K308]
MTSPHDSDQREPADLTRAFAVFAAEERRLAPPPGHFATVRRRATARRRRRALLAGTATLACLAGAGIAATTLLPGAAPDDRPLAVEERGDSADPAGPTAPAQTHPAPGTAHPDGGRETLPVCASDRLEAAVAATEGAAGSVVLTISLTNAGDSLCAMTGFPGVSLVAGDEGTQIGNPAEREDDAGGSVRVELAPGAAAVAEVRVTQAGNYPADTCEPVAARGLRIYPPDQRAALFLPHDGLTGCAAADVTVLAVTPVRPADLE